MPQIDESILQDAINDFLESENYAHDWEEQHVNFYTIYAEYIV